MGSGTYTLTDAGLLGTDGRWHARVGVHGSVEDGYQVGCGEVVPIVGKPGTASRRL